MRIALIHDCIIHVGGAERVLQNLHAVYPEAPIYTLISNEKVARELLPGAHVHTSFAQHLPWSGRHFRAYFPLYPMAVESFDLRGFDLILSSSFAFAKGIIPPPEARHVCYCYTPLRYLWSEYHAHRSSVFRGPWKRLLTDPLMSHLRMWDRLSADRVDQFIAISNVTAARIAKYYRRDSTVIHPPARVKAITPSNDPGEYYLLVSRLMPYKRIDVAVQAFNQLGMPLKIVGTGPQFGELESLAKANIELLGGVSDSKLAELYSGCRAFVYPAIEDFGIVMVEAQAYGKPVIACAGGGAAEIVVHGETGVLFAEQTQAALIDAIKQFANLRFDGARIREHAMQFDESVFREKIRKFIEDAPHVSGR
ncbi:MAG: glycosyltransferase [Acidobacteriota bacterium]|nr:glycosyltransferase [Acidobacteriota bacterium]